MSNTRKKNAPISTLFKDIKISEQPCGMYEVRETTAAGKDYYWKFVKLAANRWFMVLESSTMEYSDNEMQEIYYSFRFVGGL